MFNRYHFSDFPPRYFEKLARELIQAREKRSTQPISYFQTYKEGKDGGIDFKVPGKNIYGQARKCDTDFKAFFRGMKRELPKVQKMKPERYFIVTNLPLSAKNKKDLEQFFHPYIKNDGDILGQENLIELLNDNQIIAERYFPTSSAFATVAKESFRQYEKATQEKELFFKHQGYFNGLEKLTAESVLVITGIPGIGKSMLGRMLSCHFIENEGYDDFYFITDVKNAMPNQREGRKQIFFLDDILGDILSNEVESELLKFVDYVRGDKDSKLIITTRKYIWENGLRKFSQIHLTRFRSTVDYLLDNVINLTEFSEVAKEHILFNQIKHSQLGINITEHLARQSSFDSITGSENFSPRILEDFFKGDAKKNMSGPGFVDALVRYLNKPYEYWLETFNPQEESYKYVLLIMLVSNAPILYEDLLETFKSVNNHITLCNKGYEAKELNRSLFDLSELFIRVTTEGENKIIEFANTSIKDFLLQFLHNDVEHYIDHLIQGAVFYNQLFFAFSTKKGEEIYDAKENEELWDETPMLGSKVVLKKEQKALLLNKVLKEFHQLGHSELRRRNAWAGRVYEKRNDHNVLVWKLLCLVGEFDPSIYPQVKDLVHQQIKGISFGRKEKTGYIWGQNMLFLPRLLKQLTPHFKFNADKLISSYFQHMQLTDEIYSFDEFEDIFPDQFALFLINNAQLIQKKILAILASTVEKYTSDRSGKYQVDASLFLDQDLEHFSESFNLYAWDEFIESLGDKIEEFLNDEPAFTDLPKQSKPVSHAHYKKTGSETKKVPEYNLLLPEKEPEFTVKNALQYFQDISTDATKQYLPHIKKNRSLFLPFLSSKRQVESLVHSCELLGAHAVSTNVRTLYRKHFDYIFYEFRRGKEIPANAQIGYLVLSLIIYLYSKEEYFKKSVIEEFVNGNWKGSNELSNEAIIEAMFETNFLFEKNRDWYSYPFRAQIPFFIAELISTYEIDIKLGLYKAGSPDILYGNVNAPAVWKYSQILDNSFFTQHVLIKQLTSFLEAIETQPDADRIPAMLRYLGVSLYLRYTTESIQNNSFDVWKIGSKRMELLWVLDLLGAKLDFQLLTNWFKKAFKSKGEVKQIHDSIVEYIKSFNKKDSFTMDPSPVNDHYTAFRIFQLEKCLPHAAFLTIIKDTLFAGEAADLVGFCKNKLAALGQGPI